MSDGLFLPNGTWVVGNPEDTPSHGDVLAYDAVNDWYSSGPPGGADTTEIGLQVKDLVVDSVRRYGAVGDGTTDDSAAFVAALAANPGRTVHVPAGEYRITSATRLQVKSFTALAGDPNGATTLRFTHASGGITLADTLGPDSSHVYGATLRDLNISGDHVAAKLITGAKVEEATLDHIELHDWTDAAVELTDTSLVHLRSWTPGLAPGTEDRVALRLKGVCGYVRISDANHYACTPVEVVGTVSHLDVHGWHEGVRDVVRVADTGVSSIGLVKISGHLISTLAATTVFRYASGAGMNVDLLDWSGLYAYLTASTAPLIDLSAVDNSGGTVRVRSQGAMVTAPNVPHLVAVHPSQAWWLVHVDHQRLLGTASDRWWSSSPYATGGCFPKPITVDGSGDPNGVITAPAGSTYHDVGTGDVWVQGTAAAVSATGWVKSLVDDVLPVIKGPSAVQSPTEVANDFGVDLFSVLRSGAESSNPGAGVLRVNGAGQARAGWDGTGSQGAFLAQGDGTLVGYDSAGPIVYAGGALNLRAQTSTDRVQFTGLMSPSQFTTAARPAAAAAVGAIIYDTDLSLPIYSNGSTWLRLNGDPI